MELLLELKLELAWIGLDAVVVLTGSGCQRTAQATTSIALRRHECEAQLGDDVNVGCGSDTTWDNVNLVNQSLHQGKGQSEAVIVWAPSFESVLSIPITSLMQVHPVCRR